MERRPRIRPRPHAQTFTIMTSMLSLFTIKPLWEMLLTRFTPNSSCHLTLLVSRAHQRGLPHLCVKYEFFVGLDIFIDLVASSAAIGLIFGPVGPSAIHYHSELKLSWRSRISST